MTLKIITADERLAGERKNHHGDLWPVGLRKTSLLKTLPAVETLCIDLEAGMKSVQDWRGDSIPVRTFADAIDVACLIGGINPAADENTAFAKPTIATSPKVIRTWFG